MSQSCSETRIFYFSRSSLADDAEYARAVEHMTKLILGMFTTRKYRVLTSLYLLWRILDYAMLVALVATLFFNDDKATDFASVMSDNQWIFAVVALEVFYDVLEFIVKIWIVNRLSIYIAISLYALYGLAFYRYELLYLDEDNALVLILFGLRFVAFVFEELIDFCIDLVCHRMNVHV